MKSATFYVLKNNINQDGLSAVERLVCKITAESWKNGKRLLIFCENKQQAIHLDKALWAYPKGNFIPHNLSGEGLKGSAPVEISWLEKSNNSAQDILINLHVEFSNFATTFTKVIDFVPYEEPLKQLARERYKAFHLAGFNLNTAIWNNGKDI